MQATRSGSESGGQRAAESGCDPSSQQQVGGFGSSWRQAVDCPSWRAGGCGSSWAGYGSSLGGCGSSWAGCGSSWAGCGFSSLGYGPGHRRGRLRDRCGNRGPCDPAARRQSICRQVHHQYRISGHTTTRKCSGPTLTHPLSRPPPRPPPPGPLDLLISTFQPRLPRCIGPRRSCIGPRRS